MSDLSIFDLFPEIPVPISIHPCSPSLPRVKTQFDAPPPSAMASLFRVRRQGEGGSGGKILRGRRTPPPASPYARPKNSPPCPAAASPAHFRSPRWLKGLISGAGKLISTVFRSEGSSSSSPGYSSDEEISLSSGELLVFFPRLISWS